MRATFSTVAILLVAIVQGQDLKQAITYTTKAKSARVVLEEISKQTGLKLEAGSGIDQEPLILRLSGVPLKEAMDKIADVMAADWVKHEDFWRLERSDARVAAIQQQLLKRRTEAYRKSMSDLLQRESTMKPIDDAEAESMVKDALAIAKAGLVDHVQVGRRQFDFAPRSPNMRFGVKEIARLDPSELASLDRNRRIVFSLTPNGIQRQLPPPDPDDVAVHNADCATLKRAIDRLKPDFGFGQKGVMMDEGLQEAAWNSDYTPGHLLMAATRIGQKIDLELSTMTEEGVTTFEDYETLGQQWGSFYIKREKEAQLSLQAQKDGYALEPVAEELAARMGHSRAELKQVSPATLNVLLDPVSTDPLALATSDTLLIGGERAGLNVVACPPEEAEPLALRGARSGKTSLELYQAELQDTGTDMSIGDGWIELKPVDPLGTQEDRVPRGALQQYYQSLAQQGRVTLEAFSKLRYACSRNSVLEIPLMGSQLLADAQQYGPLSQQCADTMRFYGSLSDEQREQAAKSSLRFDLAALSADQKEMIQSAVYDGPSLTNLKAAEEKSAWFPERTDVLPRGLPLGTKITLEDRSDPAIFYRGTALNGSEYTSYPMTIEEAAEQILRTQHPEMFPDGYNFNVVGWMLGGSRSLDIKVTVDDHYQTEDQFQEENAPKTRPLGLNAFLASLSSDMRTQIQNQISKLLQQKQKDLKQPEPQTAATPPR